MQKLDTIIRTKLHIPLTRPGLVSRPQLQKRIAQGLHGLLTLIAAPAGFGKTTLVASGVASCGLPVAWLSLDKDDNRAGRFLTYLVAALQEANNKIGCEATQLIAGSEQPLPEAILTSLINDMDAGEGEIALVLDDYQFIDNRAIHDEVFFLLEHCPGTFHLVIVSRSDPPFPLARLRARGQTVELRAADLRFSTDEAAQFLNDIMGLHLDTGAVAVLDERTEGWIAGLQMAALSMRGREDVDSFIRLFAGTNRFIMDFMLEEVLTREPEEVQTFLLQTAILARLSGQLCDAVTGSSGSQEMLERLERRNLFVIPLDNDRRWYRYHHLFADLLQARLYQSGPDQVARLLSRAAEWCEGDGQIAEAIGYALTAHEYERAADLIARYWHIAANNGEIETVWSWLDALPEDKIRNSASLGVAICWVLWFKGQIIEIEPHLVDAENAQSELVRCAEFSTEADAHPGLSAHLAVLRSIVARFGNDLDAAVVLAERALHLAPENLPPQANAQLRTVIFLALASAYDGAGDLEKAVDAYAETIHWSRLNTNAAGVSGMTYRMIGALRILGRLRAADEACREALKYIEERGMTHLPATGILYLTKSELLLERNDIEAAEAHLATGKELGKLSGRFDWMRNVAPVLARLKQARHDASGALAAVQDAELALGEPPSRLAKAELLALRASVLVRQGALTEAAQCVEKAVYLAGRDQGQTGEVVALAACRVTLAQGKLDETIAKLRRSIVAADECGRLGTAIEMSILLSLALVRQRNPQEAESNLERALTLAEPEGYVRIFIDEGIPMKQLLAQWLAHAGTCPLRNYAISLLSHFDTEPHGVTSALEKASLIDNLVEPLTPRELDVLSFLTAGLSNRQIAEKLILSEGTVKFYVHAILEKLGVHSRTQAILIAKERNLI